MNKSQIISFFDRHAPGWDANIVTDDIKINRILDAAGIKAETTVLDVACGTGVLFPYYLERSVPQVTGVDISSEMIRIASGKIQDERIRAICGDMETIPVSGTYDCAVVYNAFPHFEEPKRLIERLSLWVKPGGRFTVAHSMGLKELARHHEGSAKEVSRPMLPAAELAAAFMPWFCADTVLSNDDMYLVSGIKNSSIIISIFGYQRWII